MRKKGKENRMCNPCRNAGNIWDKTLSADKKKKKKHGQLKRRATQTSPENRG